MRIDLNNIYLNMMNELLNKVTRTTKLVVLLLAVVMTATAKENFVSGGKTRTMNVYAPANLPAKRPLLISCHGMNQSADYQQSQAKYENVADTAKFVVVYPDGEGNADGSGRGWDLGGTKDINFVLDIIEEMVKRYDIDRNRVYLSGFSMGGMFCYYAMTKIADKIAAFAPCSGYNMGGPNAVSSRPVPILHVHGDADDVCTYGPVPSHIDAWVKRNQCSTTPEVINPYPQGTTRTATMYRYRNGLEGVEVAHLKLPGKGHWHSNDPVCCMTNEEVWNFCSRWSLVRGPKVTSIYPEDHSFDMIPSEHNTFTLNFDKPVDCSKVKAGLVFNGKIVTFLTLKETGESKTLTFSFPSTMTFENGDYILRINGISGKDGTSSNRLDYNYTYGIQEVSDVPGGTSLIEQTKGNYHRALLAALAMKARLEDGVVGSSAAAKVANFNKALEMYGNIKSIQPSDYATPTTALVNVVKALDGVKMFQRGDADADGKVDLVDANIVVNRFLDIPVSRINTNVADANQDGVIDMIDANIIVNKTK